MKVLMTELAGHDLDGLGATSRAAVLEAIHALAEPAADDPTVDVPGYDAEVRLHAVRPDGSVLVYRVADIDDDGTDEVVVLTVFSSERLAPAAFGRHLSGAAESTQIGHEILSTIATSLR
jgi:hypothetical protein